MRLALLKLGIALSGLLPGVEAAAPRGELTVRSLTGVYTGLVNEQYSNVREFRSIPYAQPPVGKRRWLPPLALTPSGQHHYSYRFPPTCPQYLTKNNTVWNSNITDFSIAMDGQSMRAGTIAQSSSEDCLSLALWTPANISSEDRLPVAIFLPGGSFTGGGINIAYQKPAPFVSRTNGLIMATVGYRLNIIGFPNAAGLDDQNLGILDQRMAVEWLHSNIAAFGGDPERMVLWGHSAGAVAADVHNYAYHDNPLVAGFFMMSGTAAVEGLRADPEYSNFTFVAKRLGCDFASDPAAELACMRQVPITLLTNFVGQYAENSTKPALSFKPIPDERVIFGNYSDRAARGLMAQRPALVSTTSNEETSLYKYPTQNVTDGPYMPSVDRDTLSVFVCPASNTTDWRAKNKLTTYRYQFAGNLPSITPLPWMGAYHAVDIPLMFGTYSRRESHTDFDTNVAQTMQDYLFAFIADPEHGLRNKGWPPHNSRVVDDGFMMRFAAGGKVWQNISSLSIDKVCLGQGTYNNSPS